MRTYELFVEGEHETRSIRATNEDQQRAVIAIIVVYVCWQRNGIWGYNYDLPHNTASYANKPFNQIQAHTKQYKRTRCSCTANATPVPYIQQTKINADPSSPL